MQHKMTGFIVVLTFILSSAAFAAESLDSFVGTWGGKKTKAIYQINLAGDALDIQAVDTSDGERFVIKDIQILNGELFFTSIMPSTGWTVHHHLLPVSENELQVFRSGDSSKGGRLIRQ